MWAAGSRGGEVKDKGTGHVKLRRPLERFWLSLLKSGRTMQNVENRSSMIYLVL